MGIKKILLWTLLILGLIGCNTEKSEIKDSVRKLEGAVISENPKEFTIFGVFSENSFDGNLPVYRKAFEMTNVKLTGVTSRKQRDEVQAFKMMLDSGNLPDIIAYEFTADLESLGISGQLIPLEELIEKNAPNIKKFWEENPKYKKDAIAADGHIYMIPNYNDYDNLSTSQGYYIRKDWLRRLELKEPETVDELYNVLKAFRDLDPNQNGKKDEIPMFIRGNTNKKTIITLLDVFKAKYEWYIKDGVPVFGPAEPEFKTAVKELARWYEEKLIDQEIFTRGANSRDYMLANNLGGFTNDWFSSTGNYNKQLRKNIPDFDFGVILPPEYNGSRKTVHARTNYLGGWGITSAAKELELIIKYFDFWYSKEGRRLWNFGIEGEDYTMVNGKPQFTDKILNNPEGKTALKVIRESGAQYRLGCFQDGENERQWADKEAVEAIDLYIASGVVEAPIPELKYTSSEMEEFLKIDFQLYSLAEDMVQRWILGVSDVENDWNEYIKKLDSIGLKKVNKIQKQAYERYMK